jgi:hypothetical protein
MKHGDSRIDSRLCWDSFLIPTLSILFRKELTGRKINGFYEEYLGKPSQPEASSLYVDWLPALFAHTEEYPRPWAAAREPAFARSVGEGPGSGNQVIF